MSSMQIKKEKKIIKTNNQYESSCRFAPVNIRNSKHAKGNNNGASPTSFELFTVQGFLAKQYDDSLKCIVGSHLKSEYKRKCKNSCKNIVNVTKIKAMTIIKGLLLYLGQTKNKITKKIKPVKYLSKLGGLIKNTSGYAPSNELFAIAFFGTLFLMIYSFLRK